MTALVNEYPDYRRLYRHRGLDYRSVLRNAHTFLRPKSYLEIGVYTGGTLALSTCATIGVDPHFRFSPDTGDQRGRHISEVMGKKPSLMLFQQTSDDFFAMNNAKQLAGGPVSMAFLDGLHHAEVLLRDFFNTEKVSDKNSVIFMHDCLPSDIYMARRDSADELRNLTPKPKMWAGDVWKAVFIIRKYRPDLRITSLDATPTGLVAVTNLDPDSTVLPESYDELFKEMQDLHATHDVLAAYLADCRITSTAEVASEEGMRRTLGLPAS
jgi:hypothetical protein